MQLYELKKSFSLPFETDSLTGAVNMMLLLPGCNVTSFTCNICAPSFIVRVAGLRMLGVFCGELLSWWRITKWVFLQTTPVELRELSVGLLSWISSSSKEIWGAMEGGPADELRWWKSTVPAPVCLWAALDLPLVPSCSGAKWMLTASCCMHTGIGIKHCRTSSTCRAAPQCTEAVAGWKFILERWVKLSMLRVTLLAVEK